MTKEGLKNSQRVFYRSAEGMGQGKKLKKGKERRKGVRRSGNKMKRKTKKMQSTGSWRWSLVGRFLSPPRWP